MSGTELTVKGDIEVLRLRPGDVIVVSVERRLSLPRNQMEAVYEQMKKRFPDNEVIVTCGADISVQRYEDAVQ